MEMKEWKIKQEIYHRLNTIYSDDLNKVDIVISYEYSDIIKHFYEKVDQWIYPAKSYFVAVCYASWISQDYGENIIDLLKDPMLLAGNDPYFKTYDDDPDTYNKILSQIDLPNKNIIFFAGYYHSNNIAYILETKYEFKMNYESGITEDIENKKKEITNCIKVKKEKFSLL
jgi:hypothetical protein